VKSPFGKIKRHWKNNWTSRKRMRVLEMNSSGLAQKIPSCDHGNESSGSVKSENFLVILDTISCQGNLCCLELVLWVFHDIVWLHWRIKVTGEWKSVNLKVAEPINQYVVLFLDLAWTGINYWGTSSLRQTPLM